MHDPIDDDGRAARALEELRRGRADPSDDHDELDRPTSSTRWTASVPGLADLAALDPARLAAVAAAAAVAAVLLGVGAWFLLHAGRSDGAAVSPFAASAVADTTPAPSSGPTGTSTPTTSAEIVVHAAGAVVRPGLQRLASGARVADLLDAAGGPAPDADLDRLNLAAPLADGQRLFVPRLGEQAPAPVGPEGGGGGAGGTTDGSASAGSSGPVQLNTATAEQLDGLPGIGPATAAAIIDHRERNGPFASVDDLLDVRGIGPAKLEALRDLVVVG